MMRNIALAFVLAFLLAAAPAFALTCTADSTADVQLDSTKTVSVSCSGFSGETVQMSGTYTQTCIDDTSGSYPSEASVSQASPSATFTFRAISMACQGNPEDRKVTWKFTPSSGSVADSYTTFTITSPLSITAAFTNSSPTATPGSSVTITLQVSTTATQDINNLNIDVSGSSSSLGLTDKSITKIAAGSGEKTQQVSWTITAPSTTGTYTLNAVVTSQNADSDTATATLTVSSAPSGVTEAAAGAAAGGGAAAVTPTVVSETQKIGDIAADEIGEATFLDSRLDVQTIKVLTSEEASNVVISVERRSSAPSAEETAPATYDVYAYLTISTLNLQPEVIKKAEIDFRVNLTWLTENNANAEDIILLRLHEGTWNKLVTNLLRQDENFAYYRSETPGFSVFGIAVEKPVTPPSAVCGDGICEAGEVCPSDCEVIEEKPQPPAEEEAGMQLPEVGEIPSYAWIFVVVIAIAVVAIIVELARKKRE